MSLLPADTGGGYGFFGYQSYVVHLSITDDDPTKMAECLSRGYIEPGTKTLTNDSLRTFCRARRAPKCDEFLREHGFPE